LANISLFLSFWTRPCVCVCLSFEMLNSRGTSMHMPFVCASSCSNSIGSPLDKRKKKGKKVAANVIALLPLDCACPAEPFSPLLCFHQSWETRPPPLFLSPFFLYILLNNLFPFFIHPKKKKKNEKEDPAPFCVSVCLYYIMWLCIALHGPLVRYSPQWRSVWFLWRFNRRNRMLFRDVENPSSISHVEFTEAGLENGIDCEPEKYMVTYNNGIIIHNHRRNIKWKYRTQVDEYF
jgi:hypothetical protein